MSEPTQANAWLASLVQPRRAEPSYPTLPLVGEGGESSVPGIHLAGELAGAPLIKLGLNAGVELIDRLHRELQGEAGSDGRLDVLIVGAGSAGLGAACRAQELGLRYLVLEAERCAQTVRDMYRGKTLFAEPAAVENLSGLWFEECSREVLLERWEAQLQELGLALHERERVTDVQGHRGDFQVITDQDRYRARRVVLALGKAGNPRKAGVPGERAHPNKLHHTLSDPGAHRNQDILVYGGGDVAAEAALALCEHNRVTLATIDSALTYPKKRNREALLARRDAGALTLHLQSSLLDFDEGSATLQTPEGEQRLANDRVFEMIGAELPTAFLKRVGVKLEGHWDGMRWLTLGLVSLFVYSLYALKKFPEAPYSWPFYLLLERQEYAAVVRGIFEAAFFPFRPIFDEAAYGTLTRTLWFQQGYLYSLTYTVVMLVFGLQAMRRWGRQARDGRYQKWRYISLISFQVGFFLIANVIAVQGLSIQHAWRAWGLYQPWPLFIHTFNWFQASDPRAVVYGFVGAGLFGTFVAIPWASHRHGKRFCTWICGCGGLAETLGDRWRHLSAKGERSRRWEFQGALLLLAAAMVTLISVANLNGQGANNAWTRAYGYTVDFWLVAVIPMAMYPFFGGKVWCRYWCPLAAYNGLLARWYGKLEIRADDACISCTQCSRHCQVGVDVMVFAKDQASFDNRNSACIQCGICIDVCPMDVLSFGQSDKVSLKVL